MHSIVISCTLGMAAVGRNILAKNQLIHAGSLKSTTYISIELLPYTFTEIPPVVQGQQNEPVI
jgi:hypothetical protein